LKNLMRFLVEIKKTSKMDTETEILEPETEKDLEVFEEEFEGDMEEELEELEKELEE
jgi:hypothetical protein